MLCATGGLNRYRFDMVAERILPIFVPALSQNGDHKAFITAHALPKGHDFVRQASTQSSVPHDFFGFIPQPCTCRRLRKSNS
jgi:hypothetical protein